VTDCWAVGFSRFGKAGSVLPEGSSSETWHVRGEILPGAKLRAGLTWRRWPLLVQPTKINEAERHRCFAPALLPALVAGRSAGVGMVCLAAIRGRDFAQQQGPGSAG
jgi:hypothetical protein